MFLHDDVLLRSRRFFHIVDAVAARPLEEVTARAYFIN
jgi:hypothetical protein